MDNWLNDLMVDVNINNKNSSFGASVASIAEKKHFIV